MKIIHLVLGKANPERMNGVNKVVYNLAKSQVYSGHNVTLWGIANTELVNYGKRPFKTVLFKNMRKQFSIDSKLDIEIAKLPADSIFHIHGGFIIEFYFLIKKIKERGYKVIFTPHGSYNKEALKKNRLIKFFYLRTIEKFLLRKVDVIHSVGESEQDSIIDIFPSLKDKCVLIPNGCELKKKINIIRSSNDILSFSYCGRLRMYTKGLDILIEGFSKYIQEYDSRTMLHIIGDGEDGDKLKSMVKEFNLTENVIFHGSKFGIEKDRIISNSDFFIHSSRYEGLPTGVLEASSLNIPCIVSKPTNMAKYIRYYESGLVIEENTSEGIYAEMIKASVIKYSNKLSNYSENTSKMVNDKFRWSKVSKELVRVYSSVA